MQTLRKLSNCKNCLSEASAFLSFKSFSLSYELSRIPVQFAKVAFLFLLAVQYCSELSCHPSWKMKMMSRYFVIVLKWSRVVVFVRCICRYRQSRTLHTCICLVRVHALTLASYSGWVDICSCVLIKVTMIHVVWLHGISISVYPGFDKYNKRSK